MNTLNPPPKNILLDIFSAAMIRAGDSIKLGELMDAWSRTGIGQEFLAEALENLCRMGRLRLEDRPGGPVARLLDARFGIA